MTDERTCPQCGRIIPPDAPGGVCPVCLLMMASASPELSRPGGVRDTNLLFALFAHLLRYVDAEQFLEAIEAWSDNPSVSVADQLVDQGIISQASRHYLEGMIAHGLDFYEGNVTKALDSIGGHERVATILKSAASTSAHDLLRTRLGLQLPENLLDPVSVEAMAFEERPGRYTGSSEYSRGGMGRILLVHDELLARDIALKELLPQSDTHQGAQGLEPSPVKQSASLIARFLREARVTGRLEHPSIVPVYELGQRANGSLYYTMRLVRGKTLRTVLQECKNLEDRLKLLPNFVDLCMGIAYAHSRGVVHRDIKPSNVMIGEFGETVIIDWGLAKVVGQKDDEHPPLQDTLNRLQGGQVPGTDKTVVGEVLGSPHYMSPEQAAGRINDIDARSDIFSLGAVLYEMLTNHAAFDEGSLEALIDQIQNDDPVPISTREPRVPRELTSICDRALQKEKGRRYSTAKEMADDVNRFLSGSLVHAYNYTFAERCSHFYRKHKVSLNVLAASVLAVIATVLLAFVRIDRSRDEAIVAKNRETVALEGAIAARSAEATAREEAELSGYRLAISLASELVEDRNIAAAQDTLWSSPPRLRNWEWGLLLWQAYDEAYTIAGESGLWMQPGGSLFATFKRDYPISIRDVNTGDKLFELRTPSREVVDQVEISATGTRLAMHFVSGAVTLWDLDSRQEIPAKASPPKMNRVQFSNDGSSLLLARDDGHVESWAAADGTPEFTLSGTVAPAHRVSWSPDGAYVYAEVGPPASQQVQVWDVATRRPVLLVPGITPTMSNDNTVAVVADGKIALWDAATGTKLTVAIADRTPFRQASFLPDTRRIVALADSMTVTVWDSVTGVRLLDLTGSAFSYVPSPDGTRVITWGQDSRFAIWDVSTGAKVRDVPGMPSQVARVRFSGDGSVVLATNNQRISAWEVGSAAPGLARHDASGIQPGVAVSPDGRRTAYFTRDRVFRFWGTDGVEINTGAIVSPLLGALPSAFGSTADEIVFLVDPFTPIVMDVPTGVMRAALHGHEDRVTALDSHPDLDEVATGSEDTRVRIWRRSTGDMLRLLEGHAGAVAVVRYSPDSQRLLSADDLGGVRLWNVATGDLAAEISLGSEITSGAWSPNLGVVALGDATGGIHIRDAETLGDVRTMPSVLVPIQALEFMNGTRLMSGDRTGLRVWDPNYGSEMLFIGGPTAAATDIRVLPATELVPAGRILTRNAEGSLRTWMPHPWTADMQQSTFVRPRGAENPPAAPPFPSRVVVVTTPEVLRKSLENLAAALRASTQAASDVGVSLSETATARAVIPLGLLRGDVLVAIGRDELRSPADGVTAVDALLARLNAVPTGVPAELRILRAGEPALFQVAFEPALESEVTVQLGAAEAVDIFSTTLASLAARRVQIIETSRSRAVAAGDDPGPGSALAGLTLGSVSREDTMRFRRVRMSPLDQIRRVNGGAVESLDIFESAVRAALAQVQSGSPATISMEIERGNFQRIILNIEVR